jgi:hypothetical protein
VTLVGLIIAIFGVAFMFGGHPVIAAMLLLLAWVLVGAGRRHEVWLRESYSRNIAFELGAQSDVRVGSKAALTAPKSNFRFAPEGGLKSDITPCPKRANKGLKHRTKSNFHSITSLARPRSVSGTVTPSAFAALRLMSNSILVAC